MLESQQVLYFMKLVGVIMKDKAISAIEVDTYVRLAFKNAFLETDVESQNIVIGRFHQDNGKTGYYINYTLWDDNHAERNLMPINIGF